MAGFRRHPAQLFRAATIANAEFFGLQEAIGTVEAGKRAGLLLMTKNPMNDVSAFAGMTEWNFGTQTVPSPTGWFQEDHYHYSGQSNPITRIPPVSWHDYHVWPGVLQSRRQAIAADGRMYVANRSLENVTRGVRATICDIDSEYYGTFGAYGVAAGQFIRPSTRIAGQPGPGVCQRRAIAPDRCLTGRARCCLSGASTEPAKARWTPRRAWPFDAELFTEVYGGVLANLTGRLSEAPVDEPWLMIVNGVLKGLLGKATTC